MGLLPCIFAFFLLVYLWLPKMKVRLAFFAAAAVWGLLVWFFTELLSSVHRLTFGWLLFSWSVVCLFLLALLFFTGPNRSRKLELSATFSTFSLAERILLGGICVILAVTALNGLLAPPNTDDVMEYHLPRVVLWASNQSVAFFPTCDFAQLVHSPWAEHAALQLYLLNGSDLFLNLIEWFSFLGCVLGASLIARFLGAGASGQLLAALLTATLPELILESSGSNNTAVGAFWIVASVVFLLAGGSEPDLLHVLLTGICLGLAVLSKGTAVVLLPALLLAVFLMVRPRLSLAVAAKILIIALVALLLNLPQSVRNVSLTGHALGLPYPEAGIRLRFRSESLSPPAVISGVLRNAALHLSVPSSKVNDLTEKILRRGIRLSGADPDDPRTTWRDRFRVGNFTTREYFSGNQGQFLLIVFVCLFAALRQRPFFTGAVWLLLGCILAFVSFSSALKWNPSSARYHLPLFVLSCAAIAVLLPGFFPRRVLLVVSFVALAASLLFVGDNGLRSFLPWDRTSVFRNSRSELYFMDDFRQDNFTEYLATAREIQRSGCQEVGIDSMLQSYVYPVMALVHQEAPGVRFQYVGVENSTTRYASNFQRPEPCAVICLGCMQVAQKWKEYQFAGGRASLFFDDNVVFWPGGQILDPTLNATPQASPAPSQLPARIEKSYRQLLALPQISQLNDWHALDSPFQDSRGARLRAKRDSVYELLMRGQYIWEWSEPLRLRANAGTASPQDLSVLQTVGETFPQLIDLAHARYESFVDASR